MSAGSYRVSGPGDLGLDFSNLEEQVNHGMHRKRSQSVMGQHLFEDEDEGDEGQETLWSSGECE